MSNLNVIDWISLVLIIIGALNWGLIGLFKFNLVKAVLGEGAYARTVYSLVGLGGLYAIYLVTQLNRQ